MVLQVSLLANLPHANPARNAQPERRIDYDGKTYPPPLCAQAVLGATLFSSGELRGLSVRSLRTRERVGKRVGAASILFLRACGSVQ